MGALDWIYLCYMVFYDSIRCLGIIKTTTFESWFYFRLRANGGQKLNLLGPCSSWYQTRFETRGLTD
jgi:hypothetical protein